jgi:hypothetical protein
MCTLACCAGRAPHAAGSGMNGLCHAGLMAHRRATHIHHELPTQQAEQFCGLPRPTARASVLSLPVAATVGSSSGVDSEHSRGCRASRKAADRAIISASALAKPCQPECGAGTFGSTNQRRPRQTAALSFANRLNGHRVCAWLLPQTLTHTRVIYCVGRLTRGRRPFFSHGFPNFIHLRVRMTTGYAHAA